MLAGQLRRFLHENRRWDPSGMQSVSVPSYSNVPLDALGDGGSISSDDIDRPRRGPVLGLKGAGAVALTGASSSLTAVLMLL